MNFIDAYKELFGKRQFTSYSKLRPGMIVQFTYDNEQKYALVVDPKWEDKMHALSLRTLSVDALKTLLNDVRNLKTKEEVYARYKNSQYTETRPYRTYIIKKIKSLREVYMKEEQSISMQPPTTSPTIN